MVCKNSHCKTEFCWVCLGPWEPHGTSWYNCNRYDEDEARAARDAQERSRAALQRYLFYCNRYMNHMQSLRFEHKLYAAVKEKMEEMQQHNMSWIEVSYFPASIPLDYYQLGYIYFLKIIIGTVSEEGRRYFVPVQANVNVHLRLRLLPKEEQPIGHL